MQDITAAPSSYIEIRLRSPVCRPEGPESGAIVAQDFPDSAALHGPGQPLDRPGLTFSGLHVDVAWGDSLL